MVFQHVMLSWIIYNNEHNKFEMDVEDTQCMDKGLWYNTTICTKLNGQIFEDYFKTGHRDRYVLMCSIDENGKEHVSMTYGASSGGGRPILINRRWGNNS